MASLGPSELMPTLQCAKPRVGALQMDNYLLVVVQMLMLRLLINVLSCDLLRDSNANLDISQGLLVIVPGA